MNEDIPDYAGPIVPQEDKNKAWKDEFDQLMGDYLEAYKALHNHLKMCPMGRHVVSAALTQLNLPTNF